MSKKQVLLAIAAALATGAYAQADPINLVEVADYQRSTLVGGAGNPNSVDYTGSGGVTYNNTYDASGLVAGAHFISLQAVPITQLVTNGAGNQTPTGTANLVQIAAVQGTITNVSAGVVTVRFDSGVARLYQSNTTFVANDLSTWGFPGTASAASPTAADDKVLKPQEPLLTGNPNAYLSNGATGNPLSVNQLSTPVLPGNSVTGTAILRNGTGADIWANRTTTGLPIDQQVGANGAVIDFTDVFQNSANTNFAFNQNAGNLAIADAIIAAFGTEAAGLLDNGGVFASGVDNGLNSGYNANLSAAGTTTGDFSSQTSNNVAPTIETTPLVGVPEPASLAAWGLIMVGVGAYRVVRRRKQKVA
jgi:hypothetical protein